MKPPTVNFTRADLYGMVQQSVDQLKPKPVQPPAIPDRYAKLRESLKRKVNFNGPKPL